MILSTLDAWSVAAALLAVPILYSAYERLSLKYKLSKAPGVRAPVVASNILTALPVAITAMYLYKQNRFLDFFDWIYRYSDPKGSGAVEIVLIGKRRVVTTEPEHIKAVLTSNFAHFGKGNEFHDAWQPFLGNSIFTTDGQLWQNSRALIRPMFVKDRVRDLEIFESGFNNLIAQLPPSGQTVDMCDLFYRMTLDVTTEYLLGHSVQSLQIPKNKFVRAFTQVQRTQMILTILLPFRRFVPQQGYRHAIKTLEEFVNPFIEQTLSLTPHELETLSKSDKEFTFLHNLALFSRDRQLIRDQIMAVLLAGRDTTASTLSWTLYELANYPKIWKKLRETVLDKVGPDGAPTYEDLKDMSYLTHALNETLRLYPAVPYNIRSCLAQSTLPGQAGQPDIAVLKGDSVVYSTLLMHRRKDLYPRVSDTFPDPAIYSPERWKNWTPKPWQFVPFNGGPRICIGQNFAMTEMAYFMVRFLQKYERIEYRGNWSAQFHQAEIVGRPGQGVPVALLETEKS